MQRIEEDVKHDAAAMIREVETRAREEADKQGPQHRRHRHPARRRRPHRRVDRLRRPPPERRHEGPHHRPRGPQHPRLRAGDRHRPHHRRHARGGHPLELRPGPPRDRAHHARDASSPTAASTRPASRRCSRRPRRSSSSRSTRPASRRSSRRGVHGLHPELVRTLGRLQVPHQLRPERAQALPRGRYLAGVMAAELGVDVKLAKRAGLLHDIGKAIDHEVEGPHARHRRRARASASASTRRSSTASRPTTATSSRRPSRPSSSRPPTPSPPRAPARAARRSRATSSASRSSRSSPSAHKGVEKVYAMQAGREIRVMVKPEADLRRRLGRAGAGHRQADRGGDGVPGPDQGHGHPREPRRRVRQVGTHLAGPKGLGGPPCSNRLRTGPSKQKTPLVASSASPRPAELRVEARPAPSGLPDRGLVLSRVASGRRGLLLPRPLGERATAAASQPSERPTPTPGCGARRGRRGSAHGVAGRPRGLPRDARVSRCPRRRRPPTRAVWSRPRASGRPARW